MQTNSHAQESMCNHVQKPCHSCQENKPDTITPDQHSPRHASSKFEKAFQARQNPRASNTTILNDAGLPLVNTMSRNQRYAIGQAPKKNRESQHTQKASVAPCQSKTGGDNTESDQTQFPTQNQGPRVDSNLRFLVRSSAHRISTQFCQFQAGISTAELLREVKCAFGLTGFECASLVFESRILPISENISLDQVFASSSQGSLLQIELRCVALLGGMISRNGGDVDSKIELQDSMTSQTQLVQAVQVQPEPRDENELNHNPQSAEQKQKEKEYQDIIEIFTSSKLKTYQDAKDQDETKMKSAFAFELPQDEEYSDFIEIEGSNSLVFARYERHRAVETNCTGCRLEAERPEEEESADKKPEEDKSEDKKPEEDKSEAKKQDDEKIVEEKPAAKDADDKEADDKKADDKKAEDPKSEEKFAYDKPINATIKPDDQSEHLRFKADEFFKEDSAKSSAEKVEEKQPGEWHQSIVFYRYFPKTKAFDSIGYYTITGRIKSICASPSTMIFPGPQGDVFWIGGETQDELKINILKQDLEKHESFEIGKDSDFYKQCQFEDIKEEIGYFHLAVPRMIMVEGKRVIVFSHFKIGETPSVCFYSVDQKREILQCQGTTMLLHISPTVDPNTQGQTCIFYTNPYYCTKKLQDEKAFVQEKSELKSISAFSKSMPNLKSEAINLINALAGKDKQQIDLQQYHPKDFEGKSEEDVRAILKRDKSSWMLCPQLQEQGSNSAFTDCIAFQIQQFTNKEEKQFFALKNPSFAGIFEVKSANEVVVNFDKMMYDATTYIRHDSKNEKFAIWQFQLRDQIWCRYDISEDQTKIQSKQPEWKKIPVFIRDKREMIEKGVGIIGVMIDEMEKAATNDDQIDVEFCFRCVKEMSQSQWKIQSMFPFHVIANAHHPSHLYIAWKFNDKNYIKSIDISQVGRLFYLPDERHEEVSWQTAIMAYISGFEPDTKLTQLEIRFEDFKWSEMTGDEIKLSALLRKTKADHWTSERTCRYTLEGLITCAGELGMFCENKDIGQMHTTAGPSGKMAFKTSGDFILKHFLSLYEGSICFVYEPKKKMHHIKGLGFENEWDKELFFVEKIIHVQQCADSQYLYPHAKRQDKFIVLDNKLRLSRYKVDELKHGQINLDASRPLIRLQSIVDLFKEYDPDDGLHMTFDFMIHKDVIYNLITGEHFNYITELRKKGDRIDYSIPVRYSNQIMHAIRQDKKNLKIAFVNDPCSRSQNPFGHQRGFGLPKIERIIPICGDLYLVQSKQMSKLALDGSKYEEQKSYWFLMESEEIKPVDSELENALTTHEWTHVKHLRTEKGEVKLLLHFLKDEGVKHEIKLKQAERKVKIIYCSNEAKLLDEREIEIGIATIEDEIKNENKNELNKDEQTPEFYLIQEEILSNYEEKEFLVQVFNKKKREENKDEEEEAKEENEEEEKKEEEKEKPKFTRGKDGSLNTMIFKSDTPIQFALVDKKLFWSAQNSIKIHYFDLEKDEENSGEKAEEAKKQFKILDLQQYIEREDCGFLALQQVSPYQMIRSSHNNKLDKDTLLAHSKHLQVTTDGVVLIFDCKNDIPLIIKSGSADDNQGDPQGFVEQGQQVYTNNKRLEIPVFMESNHSVTMIRQKLIKRHANEYEGEDRGREEGKEDWVKACPTEINDCKVLGLYRTYSKYDLLMIQRMIVQQKAADEFDISVLWARFGQDTIFSVLKKELRILDSIRHKLEDRHVDQVKLANILMNLTEIKDGTGSDAPQFTSLLRNSLSETSLRDSIIKIGWRTSAFSICNVFKNQDDCSTFLKTSTNVSTQEFNVCFVTTPFTRKFTSYEWPDCCEFLSIRRENIEITKEDIKNAADKAIKNASGKPIMMNRAIIVRMLEMGWFFKDRKNFVAFANLLKNLPSKVYSSLLLQALLGSYWVDIQSKIKKYQFLPFCIFAILSITHFTNMLYDRTDPEVDTEGKPLKNFILSAVIFPFWVYLLVNEIRQIFQGGKEYFQTIWNWIDMTSLLLTALVIMMSFETFAMIPVQQIRALASLASCALVFKIFDWLRLFESTAFFVLLMIETLADIKDFMILIVVSLLMFGLPMTILNGNRTDQDSIQDSPIGFWIIDMIIGQYLLALGDWDLENYSQGPQTSICYFFFVLATFITQLTMFNMLIAIMGDTFDKITENKDVNSIKSKLDLMADLSAIMQQEDQEENKEIFFFIVMPVEDEGAEAEDDGWQGTIRTLKKIVKKQSYMVKKAIDNNNQKLSSAMDELRQQGDSQEGEFKRLVDQVHRREKSAINSQVNEIEKMFDTMFEQANEKVTPKVVKEVAIDAKK